MFERYYVWPLGSGCICKSEKIDTLGLINTILRSRTGVVDAERRERGESEQSLDGLYLSAHLRRTLMLFQRMEHLIVAVIAALTAELHEAWGPAEALAAVSGILLSR